MQEFLQRHIDRRYHHNHYQEHSHTGDEPLFEVGQRRYRGLHGERSDELRRGVHVQRAHRTQHGDDDQHLGNLRQFVFGKHAAEPLERVQTAQVRQHRLEAADPAAHCDRTNNH